MKRHAGWFVGWLALVGCADADGDGRGGSADCDDEQAAAYRGATEICDGIDNDCDGQVDEDVSLTAYLDRDGDGFGDPTKARRVCELPPDGSLTADDCDDRDPSSFPGGTEVCDGRDNDCDQDIDEEGKLTFFIDEDGDGYGLANGETTEACYAPEGFAGASGDCDDTNAVTYPTAPEICDGLDNNCDETADEGLPLLTVFTDADGDGYGDPLSPIAACGPGPGSSAEPTDCDDSSAARSPGADEIRGNTTDEDCDGFLDEYAIPGDAPDLQTALETFEDGSVLQLGPGTFVGSYDLSGRDLTLAGSGADATLLYGDGASAAITMDGGSLESLTLSGGGLSGLRVPSGEVIGRHLVLEGNDTLNSGGGFVVEGGRLTLEDSLVANNNAGAYGGGGAVLAGGELVATRVRFETNTAFYHGGGLSVRSGSATLTSTEWVANQARQHGGGLHVLTPPSDDDTAEPQPGSAVVNNATFIGNVVTYDRDNPGGNFSIGQGAYVGAATNVEFSNTVFAHHDLPEEVTLHVARNLEIVPAQSEDATVVFYDTTKNHRSFGPQRGGRTSDPSFVYWDPQAPHLADLRLLPNSPLIDAGEAALLDTDGSTSDIGAFGGPESTTAHRTLADLDQDGLPDRWESTRGLIVGLQDAGLDRDGDGLTASQEYDAGTHPLLPDSDEDGRNDGDETPSANPLDPSDGRPLAAFTAPTQWIAGEPLSLDGSLSFDPEGTPLTYAWSIAERPFGSSVQLSSATEAIAGFVPDTLGTFTLQLEVSDGSTTHTHTAFIDVGIGTILPDDTMTLDEAISTTPSGGMIALREGSYALSSTLSGTALSIVGLGEPQNVILTTEGQHLSLGSGTSLTLSRLSLTGGLATSGGSVTCEEASLFLSEVVFEANIADDDGGAIYADDCTLTIHDSHFLANEATSGGAIYTTNSDIAIVRSLFEANDAFTGGAAYINDVLGGRSYLSVHNSTFRANSTSSHGAALYMVAEDFPAAVVDIAYSAFLDNSGVSLLRLLSGHGNVQDSVIQSNGTNCHLSSGTNGFLHGISNVVDETSTCDDWNADQLLLDAPLPVWASTIPQLAFSLPPGSSLLTAGDPSLTNRTGSPSGVGPLSGPLASPIAQLDQVDLDNDGLPDGWERASGLTTSTSSGGDDPDTDGLTNLQEYQGGTDPLVFDAP